MFYMCGFVVYYIETREEMRLPRTLPLGSFTWGVERVNSREAVWPFTLKIRGIECAFDENKLHIFTRDVFSRNVVYSPMEGVVRILQHYISIHESIASSASNNEKANVLVSENIDIKDQTLNGIQMLDDARQYLMKGSTPLQQYDLGVRLGGRGIVARGGAQFGVVRGRGIGAAWINGLPRFARRTRHALAFGELVGGLVVRGLHWGAS
jgi:hypothetical protein